MKFFKYILSAVLVSILMVNCKNNKQPEVKTINTEVVETKVLDPNATYAKAEFTVKGMTCAMGCAATIEKKIAKMEGVKYAKVNFDMKLAMVEYDEAKVTPKLLETTVNNVANVYKVSDMKTVENFSNTKNNY